MQVGQLVKVEGNGIDSSCEVVKTDLKGWRKDYIIVQYLDGKQYYVEIRNCRVQE